MSQSNNKKDQAAQERDVSPGVQAASDTRCIVIQITSVPGQLSDLQSLEVHREASNQGGYGQSTSGIGVA